MGSVADKLSKLMETKSAIKSAITAKGVTVSDSDPFSSYAGKITQIESGGFDLDDLIDGTPVSYTGNATKVREYAFSHCDPLEHISLPKALTIGEYAFESCTNLISAEFPSATEIGDFAFRYSGKLVEIYVPQAAEVGGRAFYECEGITSVNLPAVTKIGTFAYYGCINLAVVDLGNATKIDASAFSGCRALDTFIIRAGSVCTISGATVFNNTPLYSGDGYFYVPKTLVSDYKSATNWTRFADQIRAIEDYPDITDITEAAA